MKGRLRHTLLGLYAVVCALAMTGPGYARFGAKIEPYVLGVPFSLAWVVLWVLATFVVLIAYHATGEPDA